jgi:histidine ammonia-lyase
LENRSLSTPGSVDSIPGKGNAEDHVSNSTWCARKAAMIIENTKTVIAGEILVAAQAISSVAALATDHPLAAATDAIVSALRESVAFRQHGDVWFATDMQAAEAVLASGRLLDVARNKGALLE